MYKISDKLWIKVNFYVKQAWSMEKMTLVLAKIVQIDMLCSLIFYNTPTVMFLFVSSGAGFSSVDLFI